MLLPRMKLMNTDKNTITLIIPYRAPSLSGEGWGEGLAPQHEKILNS